MAYVYVTDKFCTVPGTHSNGISNQQHLSCTCCCRRHAVTPYCDTVRASPLQLTCRQDQLAVAVCNLQKYPQELPLKYQVCKPPTTTNIDMFVSVLLKLVDVLFFFFLFYIKCLTRLFIATTQCCMCMLQ